MRSSILVLLALALVLVAFVPLASGDVNVTLYSDRQCQQVAQPAAVLACSSALPSQCVPFGSGATGSATLFCSHSGGSNNLTVSVWDSTNDCSGAVDETLISVAPDNTCAPLIITRAGVTHIAHATIAFIDSAPVTASATHTPTPNTDMATLLTTAKHVANTSARMGAKKGLERLFARKQLGAQ